MIASVFRKSTPLNYSIVIIAVVLFFFLYQMNHVSGQVSTAFWMEKGILIGTIFISIFTTSFIIKKNGLSKDSSYTVLFYVLFLMFFPSVMNNIWFCPTFLYYWPFDVWFRCSRQKLRKKKYLMPHCGFLLLHYLIFGASFL